MCGVSEGIMAFTAIYGAMSSRKAGRQNQQLILQEHENNILNAQDGLAAAHHSAGFSFAMADQMVELAHEKLAINKQRAQYRMMQGDYAKETGLVLEAQYDNAANEAFAISSREAYASNEQTEAIVSAGITAAASGGILISDVDKILGEVSADGAYNTAVKVWEGKTTYRQLQYQGDIKRHEGEVASVAAQYESAMMLAESDLAFEYDLLEAESVRHSGEMEIYNAQLNLDSVERSGPLAQSAGRAARRSGNQAAIGQLIGAAGSISGRQASSGPRTTTGGGSAPRSSFNLASTQGSF